MPAPRSRACPSRPLRNDRRRPTMEADGRASCCRRIEVLSSSCAGVWLGQPSAARRPARRERRGAVGVDRVRRRRVGASWSRAARLARKPGYDVLGSVVSDADLGDHWPVAGGAGAWRAAGTTAAPRSRDCATPRRRAGSVAAQPSHGGSTGDHGCDSSVLRPSADHEPNWLARVRSRSADLSRCAWVDRCSQDRHAEPDRLDPGSARQLSTPLRIAWIPHRPDCTKWGGDDGKWRPCEAAVDVGL